MVPLPPAYPLTRCGSSSLLVFFTHSLGARHIGVVGSSTVERSMTRMQAPRQRSRTVGARIRVPPFLEGAMDIVTILCARAQDMWHDVDSVRQLPRARKGAPPSWPRPLVPAAPILIALGDQRRAGGLDSLWRQHGLRQSFDNSCHVLIYAIRVQLRAHIVCQAFRGPPGATPRLFAQKGTFDSPANAVPPVEGNDAPIAAFEKHDGIQAVALLKIRGHV